MQYQCDLGNVHDSFVRRAPAVGDSLPFSHRARAMCPGNCSMPMNH